MDKNFWQHLDELIQTNEMMIDRPRGSAHPRYPEVIYPLDYGYLDNTSSADGDGIDVWLGTLTDAGLVAALATVDRVKRDIELKLLIDCSEDEIDIVLRFFQSNLMGAHLIRCPT